MEELNRKRAEYLRAQEIIKQKDINDTIAKLISLQSSIDLKQCVEVQKDHYIKNGYFKTYGLKDCESRESIQLPNYYNYEEISKRFEGINNNFTVEKCFCSPHDYEGERHCLKVVVIKDFVLKQ